MDQENYETNLNDVLGQAPQETPVNGFSDTSRPQKESPFADSPYEAYGNPQGAGVQSNPVYGYGTAPSGGKKRSGKGWKVTLSCLLVVALIAAGCGITAASVNRYWAAQTEDLYAQFHSEIQSLQDQIKENSFTGNGNSVSGTVNTTTDGSLTPGQVYAKCVESVVAVTSTSTQGTSSGSGFILTEDGYVVSNYHVVEGGKELTVTTHSGEEYEAKLIGYDSANDISVLKIDATGLTAAKLGSSDNLIIGDMVVAIGNPLGELTATQTVGYVSGKDRTVTTDGTVINMLQTDAAINPGNSGGPLFNMYGEVVGITTAKYSGTTSSGASIEGIGFAIPIDDVAKKIQDLKDYGYITGAYLGVTVQNMDPSITSYLGIPTGVYVKSVSAGSCAETAGIHPKDIILRLGQTDVESMNDLTRALQDLNAGDTTSITVWRGGKELTLSITLDERPHTSTIQPEG